MNDLSLTILPESPKDAQAIERLHERTFGPGRFVLSAYRLREHVDHLLDLSFTAWIAVVAAWHLPQAYDYALRHQWAHDLEHGSFVLVGLLAWAQLVDPARRRALSVGGRAGFALGMFAAAHAVLHPPLLGGRVLYAHYRAVTGRPLGLSPLADQHLSAWLMTVEQAFALGACLVFLLRRDRSPRLSTAGVQSSTGGR